MDEPQHEQPSISVDEILRRGETHNSLNDLVEVMEWQSIGAPNKGDQDFIRLAHQASPDDTEPLLKKKDPRWKHVIEGVKTLSKTLRISNGKDSTTYIGEPNLSHVNGEFFEGISDTYPISSIEEATRLKSLSPEELVAEIGRIHQREIAVAVGNKESSDGDPLREDIANMFHAIWMLRNEGFKMGLRSAGLTIDSNGSVVPGGARLSRDQQSEAVNLFNDHLPVIMRRTYGKENFNNGEEGGYDE